MPSGEARLGNYREARTPNRVWITTKVMWWALKITNTVAKVFVMIVKTVPGFIIDRLDAGLNYLHSLGGNTVYYPIVIIQPFFMDSIFLANIPGNPSKDYANDLSCRSLANFYAAGRQCSLLYNYGSKLVTLFFYLLLGLAVSGVCVLIFKKHKTSPLSPKTLSLVTLVNDYFGVRYFVSLMDVVSAELLGDTIHNIFHGPKGGAVTLGFIISLFIVYYYLTYAVMLAIFLKRVKKSNLAAIREQRATETGHTRLNSEVNVLTENDAGQVVAGREVVNYKDSRVPGVHPVVAWLFELHLETFTNEKLSTIWVFTPLMIFIKTLLIQLVLSASYDVPIIQNILILILEIVGFVIICMSRVKNTIWENIYDILMYLGYTLYVFLRTVLTLDITWESYYWRGCHMLMGFILLCMIALTMLYSIYLVVKRFVDFFKALKNGGRGNRVVNSSAAGGAASPAGNNRIESTPYPKQNGNHNTVQPVEDNQRNIEGTAQKNKPKQMILGGQKPASGGHGADRDDEPAPRAYM